MKIDTYLNIFVHIVAGFSEFPVFHLTFIDVNYFFFGNFFDFPDAFVEG